MMTEIRTPRGAEFGGQRDFFFNINHGREIGQQRSDLALVLGKFKSLVSPCYLYVELI